MAEAVSSSLTFRDFIRHLLPTATALCLFTPLLSIATKVELGGLVFAAVVLGYVITTPLTKLLSWLFRFTPVPMEYQRRREWIQHNWDLDELFYNRLSSDEREYTYLTGAYVTFYQQLSFYLLVYAGVNLFFVASSVRQSPGLATLHDALKAATPIAGGLELSSVLLLAACIPLAYYAFADYLNEYKHLFLENGQYDSFARSPSEN